ncbi:DUF494 domain-containing protein [Edwardsiella piscicida]|nr:MULTISPECIES: DUF494 family protein [Edwardsiella]AKM46705.1 hypothetical protein QY76_04495 [Edwardsiella sp. EA181011]ACR70687.2 Protein of unknown function (DUF494) [Edwardsiella ictaluri 93-146]AGH75166.1 hypothetical protein ETAC_15225 [Edwardsiella piscicida C07-087]AOP44371.1 DUF494 family protein [Edwardsiella piscicida]ARD18608.1 hypothetical protein BXA22_09765 [Edwardsiella piscicida]
MFDVLMYLFETYIHTTAGMHIDQDKLTDDLTSAGFERGDIFRALNWLEKLAMMQEEGDVVLPVDDPHALRLYTADEMACLDSECRGFLLFLEQIQLLTPEIREMVIDRVMALEIEQFELDDLKWVVLMVLFNAPGHEHTYRQMEELLFEVHEGYLH